MLSLILQMIFLKSLNLYLHSTFAHFPDCYFSSQALVQVKLEFHQRHSAKDLKSDDVLKHFDLYFPNLQYCQLIWISLCNH
uniref:Putative secreted protein n=1 Tax=Panstrongylus lignarius TaxID=156445 RepID=A0A224Y509_9HEMI